MARRTEPDDDDRDVPVRVPDDALDDDDEPEGDEPDDEDEPDDDEPDDAPRDRRTKAQLLAELERKERSLKRARRDARRNRARPPAKATPPARRRDAEPDDEPDDRRSERDRERREAKAEREALTARAEAALLRAGCDPDVADVLADRVRERDVDFDDDDRPDFTEWIEDMKENRPRAFTASRSRRRAADDDDDQDERPRRRRTASLDQGSASTARRTPESKLSFGQRAVMAGRRADGMESDRRRRGR